MGTRSTLSFAILSLLLSAAPASAAWIRNGDSLCTAAAVQSKAAIVSDNAGGAVVVWRDQRNSAASDLYARAINAAGTVEWGATGIPVCVAQNAQSNQALASDDKGGAIVVWEDSRKTTSGSAVYAQRIRANGNIAWTLNGVAVDTSAGYQMHPSIVPDGSSGAIIAWDATRSGRSQIYAQRFDSTGVAKWAAGGVAVAPTLTEETDVVIAPDGANGILLAWSDARSTAGGYNSIYAQRITSSGSVPSPWPASGVPVCDALQSPLTPVIARSDSGGAVIAWEDYRDYVNTSANIYAQRIASDGTPRWAVNGIPVCGFTSDQTLPLVVSDGVGGAILAWQDDRLGASNSTHYAQRVTAGGTAAWAVNGIPLCSAPSYRSDLSMISDGAGGAIASWVDYRPGVATDIYAQRVSAVGSLGWGIGGMAVCDTTNDQQLPVLVSDGGNGAVIAWHDNRNSGTSSYDIYALRVNAGVSSAVAPALPVRLRLEPPRPNPAAGPVRFAFQLSEAMPLEVALYDPAGRCVRRLARGERFEAGAHILVWDGRDDHGALTAPGLYFVSARAGAERAQMRIVRIR